MTAPATIPISFAVNCYTCRVTVWQGNIAPADGQVLLTAYAESTSGKTCPSGVADCPHKTGAVNATKQQSVPALLARIAALEARGKP